MSLLVVGSIALDTVETPAGRAEAALGGSAVYFTAAAHRYAPVRLVGVVGQDFPQEHIAFLKSLNADTAGLTIVPGRTFRWHGRYQGAMNEAETVDVSLNVFGEFDPVLPEAFRDSRFVFLANGAPQLQLKVLDQVRGPELVAADTMNLWIETQRPALEELIRRVDVLCLNEGEARMLTGEHLLARAARRLLERGLKAAVIKKGEHGMTLATAAAICSLPAYPVQEVADPTGAGDSFAGAMMGYVAMTDRTDPATLLRAAAHGTAMASFTVGGFGPRHISDLPLAAIEERVNQLRALCTF
jgi:sugar/nucleoside kinase (ribokinase family)